MSNVRFALIAASLTGCLAGPEAGPPVPTFADGKADGAVTPACSLAWWDWLNHTYLPLLDQPAADVSDATIAQAVRGAPDMGETSHTYGLCFQGAFDKYVFAQAAFRLHHAHVQFIDRTSSDYLSYAHYLANIAMPAELSRNAKALAAIQPHSMERGEYDSWMVAYTTVVAEAIGPVGLPGPTYYENVVEPEWVIDDAEAPYVAMMEDAAVPSTQDGAYDAWLTGFKQWVLGPPPGETPSFVFNLPWEPGASHQGDYDLHGIVIEAGVPVIPAPVRTFLDRLEHTRPPSIGAEDSAGWMSQYNARMLRALGDATQQQPLLDQTDELALEILEEVVPAPLTGLFAYETWRELVALQEADRTRLVRFKPCVPAADLAAAQAGYEGSTVASLAMAAPAACR